MTFCRRKFARSYGLLVACCLLGSACAHFSPPTPPVAKISPLTIEKFGDVRTDNYSWLRERSSPEVLALLEAENSYAQAMLRHTEPIQEQLYAEMVGRIKESDSTVPARRDTYYYYSRTEAGKQYPIICRRHGSPEAPEEILLDANALAADQRFFRIGDLQPSPDHRLLAYTADTTGAESYTLFIKELESGKLLNDRISGLYYGLAWASDNRTLFYVTHDAASRPYKVFRHLLGGDPRKDVQVAHEADEAFHLTLRKTRSRAFILISAGSMNTTEIRFLPADRPTEEPRVLQPRVPEMEYSVDHQGDRFLIVTNDGATNFRLVEAPVTSPTRDNWKEIVPHREQVKLDSVEAFRDFLVLQEREAGLPRIRIIRSADGESHTVDFPEPVYSFWLEENPEFDAPLLRFVYTSLTTPNSVFDYDMRDKTRKLLKEEEVRGGFERTRYQSARVFASAPDGVPVPVSLVYRKSTKLDGTAPLLLIGYGAYGVSYDTWFDPNRLSLLDRGFVLAFAHVRGGGELGRHWYEQGKLLHKRNTFSDFIACAEFLISDHYTAPDRLAISGTSAGGLLIGAVVNMRPDLFRVVVARVPFVDVLSTMLDATLPLTIIEYDEWGNPNERQFYDCIRSYSPFDNVRHQTYPDTLVTASLNDTRVNYWEPAKWVSKLRASKTDHNLLLLKTKMEAGHAGASGRYDHLRDTALEYAFIIDRLGAAAHLASAVE